MAANMAEASCLLSVGGPERQDAPAAIRQHARQVGAEIVVELHHLRASQGGLTSQQARSDAVRVQLQPSGTPTTRSGSLSVNAVNKPIKQVPYAGAPPHGRP